MSVTSRHFDPTSKKNPTRMSMQTKPSHCWAQFRSHLCKGVRLCVAFFTCSQRDMPQNDWLYAQSSCASVFWIPWQSEANLLLLSYMVFHAPSRMTHESCSPVFDVVFMSLLEMTRGQQRSASGSSGTMSRRRSAAIIRRRRRPIDGTCGISPTYEWTGGAREFLSSCQ